MNKPIKKPRGNQLASIGIFFGPESADDVLLQNVD
jgi:hypothetical protein